MYLAYFLRKSWLVCLAILPFMAISQPNIVFYLADDHDVGDYGVYGNDLIHTPAVDALAKQGLTFTNAFTGQAICAPSRSQLYTGNYPLKNGAFLNHVPVKDSQISIAQRMSKLGYEVILAGKSHVKPESVFDWDHEWESVEGSGPRKNIPLENIESYFKSAKKPFVMFIASMYPHTPYHKVTGASSKDMKFYPHNEKNKNSQKAVDKLAGYYRNVEEDNKQLENVIRLVDKYLKKNTLLIYSSDHGVSGKYTVYDRGLKVPFIARWPGVIKAGSQSDVMIHYTDVVPTFIELAGGKAPTELDGKSFAAQLKGSTKPVHKYVYGVSTKQNTLATKVFPSRMIRSKNYKYIRNLNSIEVVEQNLGNKPYVNEFIKMGAQHHASVPYEELYDLTADPYEQNNLAASPRYQKLKLEMANDLLLWMKQQNDVLSGNPGIMPILDARYKLDKPSKYNKIPKELENTLKPEDYLYLHY